MKIIGEDAQSISMDASLIKNKLNYINNVLNNCPLFPVKTSNFNVSCGGTKKNVDKYHDGGSYGKYFDLNIYAEAKTSFLPVTSGPIPIPDTGFYLKISGALGDLSGKVTVAGTYDESVASYGNITGNISGSILGCNLTGEVDFGVEFCHVGLVGDAILSNVTLSGDVSCVNQQLILQPKLTIAPLTFKLSIAAKAGTISCKEVLYDKSISLPYSPIFNPIILYNN